MIYALIVLEFLCGSLMFSYWLGLAARKDITLTGDGNPGAHNLWHAGGFKWGIAGVFLDYFKGFFPLALIIRFSLAEGMWLVPVAAAPILGHAFSPFLKWKGGKAIAVTFGVWSAVTLFEVSLAYGILLALFSLTARWINKGKPASTQADGFMAVLGMLLIGAYLYVRGYSLPYILLWIINTLILAYTNRTKLVQFFGNMRPKRAA